MTFFKTLLICSLIGVVLWFLYYLFFSVRLRLQTVNFFTGSLGSGKSVVGTRTAVRLRRRSVLLHYLFGWIPKFGKRCVIRDIYSNYPILIKRRKRYFKASNAVLFTLSFCEKNNLDPRFLSRKVMQEDGSILEVKTKDREGYTDQELQSLNLTFSKEDVLCYQQWSYALSPDHLVEVIMAQEYCIIVYDEVSLDFPSQRDKSDPRLVLAFHFLRHKIGCTLIFMDQSIDCDIAIRRRLNIIYNLSDFRNYLFLFFVVSVNHIVYMEDVVVNVNDINSFDSKFYFGFFGRRAFVSRYMKYLYYAKPDLKRVTWKGFYVTDTNSGYVDVDSHKKMADQSWSKSAGDNGKKIVTPLVAKFLDND